MYKIAEINVLRQIGRNRVPIKRFIPFTDDRENRGKSENDIILFSWISVDFSPINYDIFYDTYDKAVNVIEEYKSKLETKRELGLVKIYDID